VVASEVIFIVLLLSETSVRRGISLSRDLRPDGPGNWCCHGDDRGGAGFIHPRSDFQHPEQTIGDVAISACRPGINRPAKAVLALGGLRLGIGREKPDCNGQQGDEMRQIGGWQTDGPISFYWEGRGPKVRPCQYRSTKVFGLATLLLLTTAGGSHVAGASPPATALPPFPGVAEAVAQFDRLDAPGVTKMQRRLIVFEGGLGSRPAALHR